MKVNKELSLFNLCNGHIGGMLGEVILHYFLKNNLIKKENDDYVITEKGYEELELIGIGIDNLIQSSKERIRICSENEFGILYEHIGSVLGQLIYERLLELQWIRRKSETTVELTKIGLEGLRFIGIQMKNITAAS